MAFEFDVDEVSGVFSMRLTEVPPLAAGAIAEMFVQSANLIALYSEAATLESQATDLMPDTPMFTVVAQAFLLAQARLSQATDASKIARDVLSGKVDLEDHPLLFDDE